MSTLQLHSGVHVWGGGGYNYKKTFPNVDTPVALRCTKFGHRQSMNKLIFP